MEINQSINLKWLCRSDNNGIFITEKHNLSERAITHIQNKILKIFLLIDGR